MKEFIKLLRHVATTLELIFEFKEKAKTRAEIVWPKEGFTFKELCKANPDYSPYEIQCIIKNKVATNKRRK